MMLRWARQGVRKEEKRNAYRIFRGKPQRKRQWEDLDVGGRIILNWILET
jgi:hypothetical protein